MRDAVVTTKISKWPFLLGDALLLWTAGFIYIQTKLPMSFPELALASGCILLGALFSVLPFLIEYRAVLRLAEAQAVSSLVSQIQGLEKVAGQISDATGRWQLIQEVSEKTTAAAGDVGERMAGEVKAFSEFMQRINDSEKSTLRLEVEKLRRSESEWLQVLVRVLDHVNALHTAGVRSGQPKVIEQLTQFQNACREVARRVGLVPFAAAPAEAFDPQRHQLLDGDVQAKTPAEGATVSENLAAGYTFQGRMLRPALVRLTPSSQPDPQLSLGGLQPS
jgi:molecular chaperone GrpE (heat shock protein)